MSRDNLVEPGEHQAVVAPVNTDHGKYFCQFGSSGTKHTPMVAVSFEILRGSDAGRRLTWYGYFTDNNEATDRTFKALRACGFKGDDLGAFERQEVDQEVQIVVEHEEYPKNSGKWRARVAFVNSGPSGLREENRMNERDKQMFSERMKSRLRGFANQTGVKAVREAPAPRNSDPGDVPNDDGNEPPVGSDDDIPF